MRVIVDYPTFVANSLSAQVFYSIESEKFIATYIKNSVNFELIVSAQPGTWATDFLTAIAVISISDN